MIEGGKGSSNAVDWLGERAEGTEQICVGTDVVHAISFSKYLQQKRPYHVMFMLPTCTVYLSGCDTGLAFLLCVVGFGLSQLSFLSSYVGRASA